MKLRILAAAAALILAAAPVMAADQNRMVEDRQGLMSVIGGGMGVMGCFMKGGCELNEKALTQVAKGMKYAAGQSIDAFKTPTPEATVKTTSSAKVWEDWATFEQGLVKMEMGIDTLVAAIGDKAAMGAAMGELGKGCKDCHRAFRER